MSTKIPNLCALSVQIYRHKSQLNERSVVVQHKKSSVKVRATIVKVVLGLIQDKVVLENSSQVKSTRS